MKRFIFLIACCWLLVAGSFAQTVTQQLQKAFQQFEADPQLKHAISSLYVIDANTGKVVFDKNSQIGLAPGSTQKIITAATAFELLGKDYRYKTELGYNGKIDKDTLEGDLVLHMVGDPTFGSWRYESAKDSVILHKWGDAIKKIGIKKMSGNITYNNKDFSIKLIPDGWIWQDLGNYYGAYADIINWKENQYDLLLKSGNKIGDQVEILQEKKSFKNELKSAAKGTGDNAYVYLPAGGYRPVIAGTIPVEESAFKISVSDPDIVLDFFFDLENFFFENGLVTKKYGYGTLAIDSHASNRGSTGDITQVLNIHYSPSLDSIIYWFLQKSINLYGEALIKTLAYEKNGFGSTDGGIKIVKDFWKQRGIDEDELNIGDGSGLSPQNRITAHAQVEILKYAKKQPWFPYFYDALPEYNNMKMKSGTIKDVKGYCGYHKAGNGQEYIFSFLVNNYSGSASELVGKMYRVLNELK